MTFTPKPWTPGSGPGLYSMPVAQYHADPCERPSLSAGNLAILLDQTPYHAWYRHPKLGGAGFEATRKTEIGSAVHRLVLDAGQEIQVIQADSYRGKEARAAQDAAEAAGLIPILADDYAVAQQIAGPLRDATETYLGAKISDCLREVVVIWQDGEGWRRALLDIVTADLRKALDLKTSRGSAAPTSAVQRIFDGGFDIQEAHYRHGLDKLDPEGRGRRTFGFLFGEVEPPHCISPPLEFTEGAQAVARERWEVGSRLWDSCLKHDYWPGYATDTQLIEAPPWFVQRWAARMMGDETLNPVAP